MAKIGPPIINEYLIMRLNTIKKKPIDHTVPDEQTINDWENHDLDAMELQKLFEVLTTFNTFVDAHGTTMHKDHIYQYRCLVFPIIIAIFKKKYKNQSLVWMVDTYFDDGKYICECDDKWKSFIETYNDLAEINYTPPDAIMQGLGVI